MAQLWDGVERARRLVRADLGDRGGLRGAALRQAAGRDAVFAPALMVTFVLAFGAAGVAGLFGALITKAAPIH